MRRLLVIQPCFTPHEPCTLGACQLEVSRGNSGTLYVYSIRVGYVFPRGQGGPRACVCGHERPNAVSCI